MTITAMLRLKNEQEFIERCLHSIKDSFDNIVCVFNNSSDNTKQLVKNLNYDNVSCYDYDIVCATAGENYQKELNEGKGSLADYYNFCKSKCNTHYICKWDGDMIATERFKEFMRNKAYLDTDVTFFNGIDMWKDMIHINNTSMTDFEPRIFTNNRQHYYFDNTKYESLYHSLNGQFIKGICYLHTKLCKKQYEHLGSKNKIKIKELI